jgi:uncharacterized membrane protein YhaH (DUF805 family)
MPRGYYDEDDAARRVAGPAIALVISAIFCLVLLFLGLAFDAWLLLSGEVKRLEQNRAMQPETAVTIRMGWTLLMVLANVVITTGAFAMRGLRNRGLSMTACVLAVIPCFGPCFLLGIPFGIWGLVVMNDPDVRRAFDRRDEYR